MKQILILSDGRLGHLNQSLAFVKYLGYAYTVAEVRFKNKFYKLLSYLFDALGIYVPSLFVMKEANAYDMVVGAGSSTYYAVKTMAKKEAAKSVTMMLPKGYRYDFDLIFAQKHDAPLKNDRIVEIPVNFSYVEPQGLYTPKKKSIGIVVGGNNKVFHMSKECLKEQLDYIETAYEGYEIAITTSPRTSKEIENLVASYHFDYEVIFSQNKINPIPDFLETCEIVFITGDSTSMISEAVSYGIANVVVLPLESTQSNKFDTFVRHLEEEGYLHIFNGKIEEKHRKIDFKSYLKGLDL